VAELLLELMNERALRIGLLGLFMRSLPFAVYVCQSTTRHWLVKVGAVLTCTLLAFVSEWSAAHLWVMGTLLYFAVASAGTWWLEAKYREGNITGGALFVICAAAFLLVPSLWLAGAAELMVLSVGWELCFASYSYCRDANARGTGKLASLKDCLFFMMVNPVLVYPERCASGGDATRLQGLVLAAVGAAGFLMGTTLLVPLLGAVTPLTEQLGGLRHLLYSVLGLGIMRFVCAYFVQAGGVNYRIGIMRSLGYAVPDSFNYPFLSTSPTDFWRRWNAYVLNWLKRYVYRPLTRASAFRRLGALSLAAAVLVTFVASGFLHELPAYARHARWVGHFAAQFTLVAVGTVLWLGVDRWLKSQGRRAKGVRQAHVRTVRDWFARAVIVGGMLTMPLVWG